ncbi:MAG: lytic transglycosylase domain-containing protein [Bacteroidia bacterium]
MKKIHKRILIGLGSVVVAVGALMLIGSVGNPNMPDISRLGAHATMVSLDPPADLNFAGEPVPLRDFEVKERFEQELVKYTFLHSATIMNIKRAARWKPEISKILRREGIPEDFFFLCIAESHLSNATSPAGAKGFWQFIEGTGKLYGLEITDQVDERYDPIKSTEAACQYLKDAYKIFNNWTLVAASYNMGIGGVKKQLERQRVGTYYDLYLNRETAAYVFAILAIKTVLTDPAKHGFDLKPYQLYAPLQYNVMTVDTTIPDLITWSLVQGTTYKMVKVLNPWILGDKLDIPKAKAGEGAKVYKIKVPKPGANEDQGAELVPRMVMDSVSVDSLPPSPHETAPAKAAEEKSTKSSQSKKGKKKSRKR